MVTVKEIQVMRASSGKEEWQEGLVGDLSPSCVGKKSENLSNGIQHQC